MFGLIHSVNFCKIYAISVSLMHSEVSCKPATITPTLMAVILTNALFPICLTW